MVSDWRQAGLALCTSKDRAAGDPITADIIAQKGSSKPRADKTTGIRLFGKSDTVNIVRTDYVYNDAFKGLYIFSGTYKDGSEKSGTDTSSEAPAPEESSAASEDTSSEAAAAGSAVGTGTMIASCAGSAALGAFICFLIARRKRDNIAA